MIELSKNEILKFKKINATGKNTGGDLYIKDDNILYKIYEEQNFKNIKEQNIDYMLKGEKIDQSGYPIEKIISKETKQFIGFSMPYYHNTKTFTELCNSNDLELEEKISVIKDIFSQLKQLHQRDILLKDIHMDNLIVNEKGHIIDLDEFILPGNEFAFRQYYCIGKNKNTPFINIPTKISDNIKMVISSLSLIYNYNFEEVLRQNYSLEDLIKNYSFLFSEEVINYLENIFNLEYLIYFDEVIDQLYKKNKTKIK